MPSQRILLILILSGEFIFTVSAAARGDQDQDILMDEELKEMTYDDLADILASQNTNSSSFDIVDEKSIDEEMNAEPDQDPVKTNWKIVLICCIVGVILILLSIAAMFLYNLHRKGNQVLVSSFPSFPLHCNVSSSRRQEEEVG